jgi:hypothetical protein
VAGEGHCVSRGSRCDTSSGVRGGHYSFGGYGGGAVFNLGKTNTVDAISKLVGTTTNSTLKVDNNGAGTALDLRVGSPTTPAAEKVVVPMKVDSQAEVANLNAQFAGHADTADSAGSAQSAAGLECTGCVDESDLAASAATQAELNNEAAICQSADTTLQNNINQEAAARQNADNALGLDD